MGVREMKHTAKLREWTGRIAECQSSGMAVKDWCNGQGISTKTYYYWKRQFVAEASRQSMHPASGQTGALMRIDPHSMPNSEGSTAGTDEAGRGITIRHGESVITLPVRYDAESIAALVKALNYHV